MRLIHGCLIFSFFLLNITASFGQDSGVTSGTIQQQFENEFEKQKAADSPQYKIFAKFGFSSSDIKSIYYDCPFTDDHYDTFVITPDESTVIMRSSLRDKKLTLKLKENKATLQLNEYQAIIESQIPPVFKYLLQKGLSGDGGAYTGEYQCEYLIILLSDFYEKPKFGPVPDAWLKN